MSAFKALVMIPTVVTVNAADHASASKIAERMADPLTTPREFVAGQGGHAAHAVYHPQVLSTVRVDSESPGSRVFRKPTSDEPPPSAA